MNRCVYYIDSKQRADLPQYLRYTVCGKDAPFMVDGSSYCTDHVKQALWRDRAGLAAVAFKILEEA